MIAAGANAIILYPLSPTALNRVIKQACAKNILVFAYDSTVTEPCAYNVSNITARYGANTAQWMANQMGGKGEMVINHGVAGTTVTKVYDEQALGVFKRYPGIKIVGDFYGNWNDSISQEEVAKILAAHPNIDGIWNVDGSYGALQAVINGRPNRLVTIAGQSNNGYRLMIADPAMQAKGLKGVSSSAGPAVGPYAFKVMMEALMGKRKLDKHNIEYPLPWVEPQDVKVCNGEMFANDCKNGDLVPELSINAVQNGDPTPGATIKPLPAVTYADDLPGVNCTDCKPPADWLEPNHVKPIPVPN
jgi:ribose transport system substrate-binding protein